MGREEEDVARPMDEAAAELKAATVLSLALLLVVGVVVVVVVPSPSSFSLFWRSVFSLALLFWNQI